MQQSSQLALCSAWSPPMLWLGAWFLCKAGASPLRAFAVWVVLGGYYGGALGQAPPTVLGF